MEYLVWLTSASTVCENATKRPTKLLEKGGLVRDLNPGPLAPKARIIPLDQRADMISYHFFSIFIFLMHTSRYFMDCLIFVHSC